MDKTNESSKYLAYLKNETGIFIKEENILQGLGELKSVKSNQEQFDKKYKDIYKQVMKDVIPQIIKFNLSRFFDNRGFEKHTDLKNFNHYLKRVDKAVIGLLIGNCFAYDGNENYSKYVLGGMDSQELFDSFHYEIIFPETRKNLYEIYLYENPSQDKIEIHKEKLENATMNAYSYIKKAAKEKNLNSNELKKLAQGYVPGISTLYQKVKSHYDSLPRLTRALCKIGKEDINLMSSVESTLSQLTGEKKSKIKKQLLEEPLNDITSTMNRIKEEFISKDYASRLRQEFIKEYDNFKDSQVARNIEDNLKNSIEDDKKEDLLIDSNKKNEINMNLGK